MVGKVRRDVVVLVVSVVVAVAVLAMEIPKMETVQADHMNVAAEQTRVNVLLLIVDVKLDKEKEELLELTE
ncbi:hypothetical protein L1887_01077 [Cichorium endivia]|nr:hypothetical protein L1887_01077 [Cichorium endivia]